MSQLERLEKYFIVYSVSFFQLEMIMFQLEMMMSEDGGNPHLIVVADGLCHYDLYFISTSFLERAKYSITSAEPVIISFRNI